MNMMLDGSNREDNDYCHLTSCSLPRPPAVDMMMSGFWKIRGKLSQLFCIVLSFRHRAEARVFDVVILVCDEASRWSSQKLRAHRRRRYEWR